MLFALDPGISAANATGVALYDVAKKQVFAANVLRRDPTLNGLEAQRDLATRACAWAWKHGFGAYGDVFVTEWPQVYPHERTKDPNKALLPLCGIIGHVSALLAPGPRVSRVMYLPREWKGTIDGETFLGRIVERLNASEHDVLNSVMPPYLRHNATDAVGLALYYSGRLTRHRAVHAEPALIPGAAHK